MPSKVFISYRRDDSRYQARMIHQAFCQELPRDNVFMDVDSIPPGANFRKILKEWVDQCEVLLALIGPGWIDVTDPASGRRRLENPSDFVRIEIGEALKRDIPVVPVLLDGAPMPDAAKLPDDLKELADRQAEFVVYRTFDADVHRLIRKLQISKGAAKPSAPVAAATPELAPSADAAKPAASGFLGGLFGNAPKAPAPSALAAVGPPAVLGTQDTVFSFGFWCLCRQVSGVDILSIWSVATAPVKAIELSANSNGWFRLYRDGAELVVYGYGSTEKQALVFKPWFDSKNLKAESWRIGPSSYRHKGPDHGTDVTLAANGEIVIGLANKGMIRLASDGIGVTYTRPNGKVEVH